LKNTFFALFSRQMDLQLFFMRRLEERLKFPQGPEAINIVLSTYKVIQQIIAYAFKFFSPTHS